MAKRAPIDEKPFRPLDVSLLSSVVQHSPEVAPAVSMAEEQPKPPASLLPLEIRTRKASSVQSTPMGDRLIHERRILLTRSETQALDRLVNNLAVRMNAQLKASHVIRALIGLLLGAERHVDQRASERAPLVRPSNGDLGALQRFEEDIAAVLSDALRDGAPLR